jgi:REP-associated tyrosine transposase
MKEPRYDRRSIRLQGFDYSQPGQYFVTICAMEQKCIFGKIENGVMQENILGKIVHICWLQVPDHFANVEPDVFVVMPNHFHAILKLRETARALNEVTTEGFSAPVSLSVPTIVRTFKAAVTREARCILGGSMQQVWQRNYYERIIRNNHEYEETFRYIIENPMRWDTDQEKPILDD